MPPKRDSKINNLQGLRAFAVLAVLFYHAGYPHRQIEASFGVDVFFVISGFIMARICDHNASFFFRRRVIRILPPYWTFTIVLYVAAIVAPHLMTFTKPDPIALIKSLLFIPFFKIRGDTQPLLFVGWSLNYEMLFYIFLALALAVSKKYATVLSVAAIVAWTFACHHLGHGSALSTFFAGWRILEFPMGIAAYELLQRLPREPRGPLRAAMVAATAVSTAWLVGCQFLVFGPRFGFWNSLGPASFLLVLSATWLSRDGWDIGWSWLVLIGDASYILYLLHPYCIYLIDRTVAKRHPWLGIKTLSGSLIAIAVATLVSVGVHLACEVPVVRMLNRKFGGRRPSTEFKATA